MALALLGCQARPSWPGAVRPSWPGPPGRRPPARGTWRDLWQRVTPPRPPSPIQTWPRHPRRGFRPMKRTDDGSPGLAAPATGTSGRAFRPHKQRRSSLPEHSGNGTPSQTCFSTWVPRGGAAHLTFLALPHLTCSFLDGADDGIRTRDPHLARLWDRPAARIYVLLHCRSVRLGRKCSGYQVGRARFRQARYGPKVACGRPQSDAASDRRLPAVRRYRVVDTVALVMVPMTSDGWSSTKW